MTVAVEDAQRVVVLMIRYGKAKFQDEWNPRSARCFIGRQTGLELENRIDDVEDGKVEDFARTVELVNQYGAAVWGDEWWPGKASSWLGADGEELERRLEDETFSFAPALRAAA